MAALPGALSVVPDLGVLPGAGMPRRVDPFRALFNGAPIGIVAFDTSGVVEQANSALSDLVGVRPLDLVGRHLSEVVTGLEPGTLADTIASIVDCGSQEARLERTLIGAAGVELRVALTVSAVRGVGERVAYLVAFVQDVTSERIAEDMRRQGEQRIRAALDSALDAFVLLRVIDGAAVDFEIEDLNARGEVLFGADRNELIGQRLTSVLGSAVAEPVMLTYRRVARTGEPVDEEVDIVLDGRTFVLHHQVVATDTGIAAMTRDVTEERLLDRRRQEEERIAQAIFKYSPVGIQIFDAGGTSARMNEAERRLLGVPSAMYGVGEFNILHDQLTAITGEADAFERAYRGETVNEFEYDVNMGAAENDWQTRKDAMTIARTVFPLFGEGGEVTGVVSFSRDVTTRVRLERQMGFLAYHDPLTQLANRDLFNDRLDHALVARRPGFVAVAYIDLDDFKKVNDTLGHAAGDELLRHVARTLAAAVREGDTVARLGGDEFALVLDEVPGPDEATVVTTRALERLRVPVTIAGGEVRPSASLGLAMACRGTDRELVLRAADGLMYSVKTSGKGRALVQPEPVGGA